MAPKVEPHGFVTRGIHWLSAALIGFGYFKGLDNVSQLADPAVMRFEVLYAIGVGLLFVIRFFWTKYVGGPTRLPEVAPGWEYFASRIVHTGLYVGVFAIVLSGLGIALAYSFAGTGGFFLPGFLLLHELSLATLPLLLAAHVAGALWHKFVRRDGVLESMTGSLGSHSNPGKRRGGHV